MDSSHFRLSISNNINKQSPWMLSLVQISNTGGSIQRLLKTIILKLHNSLQVHVKFRVRKKVFIYFIFFIYLKRMGLNLSTNLPMFVYTFQAMWCHRPLKEYSVFVGIRAASTFLSLYTLSKWPCLTNNDYWYKLQQGWWPILFQHIKVIIGRC